MRQAFSKTFIMNSDFDCERGNKALADRTADAISYGRPYISNPNLPKVFREGKEPAPVDMRTLYQHGAGGYTDYPEV